MPIRITLAFIIATLNRLILAQALPEPLGSLVAYGPVGIGVTLWLLGWLPSKAEMDRANARADRAEAKLDTLSEKVTTEIVPLLSQISRDMIPGMDRLAGEFRMLNERMRDLERGRNVP